MFSFDNPKATQDMYDIFKDFFYKYTKNNIIEKHYIATVINIYNGFADIKILDSENQRTKIKIKNGLNINIGDIVSVLSVNGNYSNLIIDFKLDNNMAINNLIFNREIKNIENFSSYDDFSLSSSALDSLNYYYGNASIKLIESNNVSSEIEATKTGLNLDLTKYNSDNSSLETDFISTLFYVSNISKTINVEITLITDESNFFTNTIVDIINGFNYNLLPKCEWIATGNPDWGSITGIRISWTSENDSANEYVSFNNIELIENKLGIINLQASSAYNNGSSYDTTYLGYSFPQSNTTPQILFNCQIPKTYFGNYYIYPRITWKQVGSNPNTKWCIDYKLLKSGETHPVSFTTYDMQLQKETYIPLSTMNQVNYNQKGILISNIDSKSDKSCELLIKLYRNDSDYSGNLIMHNLLIYYPTL